MSEEQHATAKALAEPIERIVLELEDAHDRRIKKAFEGEWIIGDAQSGEEHHFDEKRTSIRGGGDYAVALTKKGAIVVVAFDNNNQIDERDFRIFDSFDQFKAQGEFPESLIGAVASLLDVEHIEDLDI